MVREAARGEVIKPAEFVYRFEFMAAEHNYFCAVCRENKAVLDTSSGILQPCWDCQKKDYHLIKKSKTMKFLERIGL